MHLCSPKQKQKWMLVNLPPNRRAKRLQKDILDQRKFFECLNQQPGFNYKETSLPAIKPGAMCIILAHWL